MIIDINNNSNRKEIFEKRNVDDYIGFIEGDYEASLGKTIKTLIYATNSFIVYLDEEYYVEWTYNDKYEDADVVVEKFGLVINRIGFLETLSDGKLKGSQLVAFRRLLGESMARLLKEQNDKNALIILKTAEQLLNAKSRQQLIFFALGTTLLVLLTQLLMWSNLKCNWGFFTSCNELFPVVFCSLSGGFGGFIFLMARSKTLEIEPSLEESAYKFEGVLRIFYGIICAFVTYLALNSKLIFGNITNVKFSTTTILICMISGASEKILPGIIKKVESKIS